MENCPLRSLRSVRGEQAGSGSGHWPRQGRAPRSRPFWLLVSYQLPPAAVATTAVAMTISIYNNGLLLLLSPLLCRRLCRAAHVLSPRPRLARPAAPSAIVCITAGDRNYLCSLAVELLPFFSLSLSLSPFLAGLATF